MVRNWYFNMTNMKGNKMTKNILFPGRDNYEGPSEGYFGLLHHEILFEYSDNIQERVDYVKNNKPLNEIKIRLHSMIYLEDDYYAKLKPLDDDYYAKIKPLDDNFDAK